MTEQIYNERQTLIKLKELIDDNYNCNCNNETTSIQMKKLINNFRDIGIRCAIDFREQTLSIKELIPLKLDIDDNLISSLPNDLYDSYKNDDDAIDNSNRMLKSLRQLIRLQISEFFKRILLIFIENYYPDDDSVNQFNDNNFNFDKINKILIKIFKNSKYRQQELMKIISFYKSFYLQSTDDLMINRRKFDNNENNNILWQNCRNVRKNLYRSLTIIDDCEIIIDNDNKYDDNKTNEIIDQNMDLLIENLSITQEMIQSIKRRLLLQQHNRNYNTKKQTIEILPNINQIEFKDKKLIIENELPKDELFETTIDSIDNQTIINNNIDDIEPIEIKNVENNMLEELRTALKDKHIEHRIREARLQGIELDREQISNEYLNSLNQLKPSHQSKNKIETNNNESMMMGFNFQFDLNLAMRDTDQLKWHLNLKKDDEETFGDDDDDDVGDDNNNDTQPQL